MCYYHIISLRDLQSSKIHLILGTELSHEDAAMIKILYGNRHGNNESLNILLQQIIK